MNDVNKVVLSRLIYGDDLYNKVGEQVGLLTSSGYICTVIENIAGVVEISYEFVNAQLGLPYPYWLTPLEANYVKQFHDANEIRKMQQIVKEDNDNTVKQALAGLKNGNKDGGNKA